MPKQNIHPEMNLITIACSCGHQFETKLPLNQNLHVEVCSNCHPFCTGKQRLVDTAGRIERFRRKYAAQNNAGAAAA